MVQTKAGGPNGIFLVFLFIPDHSTTVKMFGIQMYALVSKHVVKYYLIDPSVKYANMMQ